MMMLPILVGFVDRQPIQKMLRMFRLPSKSPTPMPTLPVISTYKSDFRTLWAH